VLGVSLIVVSRGGACPGRGAEAGRPLARGLRCLRLRRLPAALSRQHGDGRSPHPRRRALHIEPRSTRETGVNATVGRFADGVGLAVTDESMEFPDGTTYRDGDQCGSDPAEVRVLRDGQVVDGDPEELRLQDGGSIAFVFAPTDADIPPVPAAVEQEKPSNSRE
jgi:hypothetical protein